MKEGAQETRWNMHWTEDIGTIKRRTSRSLMPLFLPCVGDIAPCSIGLCFMTILVLCFITRSSWFINSIRCSEWKRTFSNYNIQDDIDHRGKNFQTELILGTIKDDILLDNWTGWIHEGTCEIMMTWLESGPMPCRLLAQNQWYTSSNRAKWL
jgi:hypothetical protein